MKRKREPWTVQINVDGRSETSSTQLGDSSSRVSPGDLLDYIQKYKAIRKCALKQLRSNLSSIDNPQNWSCIPTYTHSQRVMKEVSQRYEKVMTAVEKVEEGLKQETRSYTESKSKLYRMISEEMNFLKQLMAKVEQDSKADTELKAALKAYLDQNQRIREEVQCLLECHPDELSGRGNGKSYCHVL
ncbi:unnamed protein product [Calicophoron daubneyi]|uniref:Uncharacterized protein n=1 Tax=Calicophoron daubneyi TaxID=300641 RepID=A0AAV2T136_CALDB